MYEQLRQIGASVGSDIIKLGGRHTCRYCGSTDRRRFRQRAHTFPEALGNHWVISRDECDDCNAKFSKYEDALAKAIGVILTIGGEKGKGHNSRRQTGMTGSASAVRHLRDAEGNRRISTMLHGDASKVIRLAGHGDVLTIRHPVAPDKFVPRYAYKALTKMAYALLPDEELANYSRTRTWLLDVDDSEDFPDLEVALSFTRLGNPPPIVVGTLMRRLDPSAHLPHILFLLSIGSLCFQIDLRSDHLDDHVAVLIGSTRLRPRVGFATQQGPDPAQYFLQYSGPKILNWSSRRPRPQPVQELLLHKSLRTADAAFELVMRDEPWAEESSDAVVPA
ncbi:MAG: hypothetical protein HS111_09990 [Kofleriaceae bacterium]|nr:hypothetical protein [Kofleriaceae bacterium]